MSFTLNCQRFVVLLSITVLIASAFLFTMQPLRSTQPPNQETSSPKDIKLGLNRSAKSQILSNDRDSFSKEKSMAAQIISHLTMFAKPGQTEQVLKFSIRLMITAASFLVLLWPENRQRSVLAPYGFYLSNGVRALLTTGLLVIVTLFWAFFIISSGDHIGNQNSTGQMSFATNESSKVIQMSYSNSFLDVLASYLLLTLLASVLLIRKGNNENCQNVQHYNLNWPRLLVNKNLHQPGSKPSHAYPSGRISSSASGDYRFIRVLRSPDGAVRHYNLPSNWDIHSIAEYIVNLYMVDFPFYNPWSATMSFSHQADIAGRSKLDDKVDGACPSEYDQCDNESSYLSSAWQPQRPVKITHRKHQIDHNDGSSDLFDCMSAITTTTNYFGGRKQQRLKATRSYEPTFLAAAIRDQTDPVVQAAPHILQQANSKAASAFKMYEINENDHRDNYRSHMQTRDSLSSTVMNDRYPSTFRANSSMGRPVWNFKQTFRASNNRNSDCIVSKGCLESALPKHSLSQSQRKMSLKRCAGLLRTAPASLCGDRTMDRGRSIDCYDQSKCARNSTISNPTKSKNDEDLLKHQRRLNKLLDITEEAFKQVKRKSGCADDGKTVLTVTEAAQAVFVTISRPLQKFLRRCRTQPFFCRQMVIEDLKACLTYDISHRAFLQRYVCLDPPGFVNFLGPQSGGGDGTSAGHSGGKGLSGVQRRRICCSGGASSDSGCSDRVPPSSQRNRAAAGWARWTCGACPNGDLGHTDASCSQMGLSTIEPPALHHTWTLVHDRSELQSDCDDTAGGDGTRANLVFLLKQADVSLLCQACAAPSLLLVERFTSHEDKQFVFNINSETPV